YILLLFYLRVIIPELSVLFPYTTLFRSLIASNEFKPKVINENEITLESILDGKLIFREEGSATRNIFVSEFEKQDVSLSQLKTVDRKSTRLNSSHVSISYAVFCLKKKKK